MCIVAPRPTLLLWDRRPILAADVRAEAQSVWAEDQYGVIRKPRIARIKLDCAHGAKSAKASARVRAEQRNANGCLSIERIEALKHGCAAQKSS
jgi:hypothetical protein